MSDESKQLSQFANRITPAILELDVVVFGVLQKKFHEFTTQLHVDVCDGTFVPSRTLPYTAPDIADTAVLQQLSLSSFETEVHLMVKDPHQIGCDFLHAGARRLIPQWESFASAEECTGVIDSWYSRGAVVALSVLLSSDISPLVAFLKQEKRIVALQCMSIDPIGVQGKPFDTRVLQRIKEMRAEFPHLEISVDGSMNEKTIPSVFHAGATRAVVGSAVAKQPDPAAAYRQLCQSVEHIMK